MRQVLVDGRRQVDVSTDLGITRQALANALARARRGLALARAAAGVAFPENRA